MSTLRPEFEIAVAGLDQAGKEFHFAIRSAWVQGVLEDHEATSKDKDGVLSMRISKSGPNVMVQGHMKIELSSPCARCLKPVDFLVDQELSLLMVPQKDWQVPKEAMKGGEYEFSSEDANVLPYDGEKVILDSVVRDELILETPMIPLCSQACPGIGSAPSFDLTSGSEEGEKSDLSQIDPRLLPLMKWKVKAQ